MGRRLNKKDYRDLEILASQESRPINKYNQFRENKPELFIGPALFRTNLKTFSEPNKNKITEPCLITKDNLETTDIKNRHSLPVIVQEFKNPVTEFRQRPEKDYLQPNMRFASQAKPQKKSKGLIKKNSPTYFKGLIEIVNNKMILTEQLRTKASKSTLPGLSLKNIQRKSILEDKYVNKNAQNLKNKIRRLLEDSRTTNKVNSSYLLKNSGFLCSNPCEPQSDVKKLYVKS